MPNPVGQILHAANRWFYAATIETFLAESDAAILGKLTAGGSFSVETTQRNAWLHQIVALRGALRGRGDGWLAFEFTIPRVGSRVDVVILLRHALFAVEFKVGEQEFQPHAVEQAWDYALDLKNFHSTSHEVCVVPVLVATHARLALDSLTPHIDHDNVLRPICTSSDLLGHAINTVLAATTGPAINWADWASGGYAPTPTIVEAATALYRGHSVEAISRNDAGAINLTETTTAIDRVIQQCRQHHRKAICFVTGVPGAGKTLAGLHVATRHMNAIEGSHATFLSGNGPLVAVLREALAADRVASERAMGRTARLEDARRLASVMVQNVHHFRNAYVEDLSAPHDRVVIFDEAQRAWNLQQTASFMRDRGVPDFAMSEPEFLISCLDRHVGWAVIVCLVGGGQEINTGEAGIGEWLRAIGQRFSHWQVHVAANVSDTECDVAGLLPELGKRCLVQHHEHLHLSVSMRSFRAESLSKMVKSVLDLDVVAAQRELATIAQDYPIVVTRSIHDAKTWLRRQARGSERFGLVVSSQAKRLRPLAIDVRVEIDPVNWFLKPRSDVRSSYYLEDAGTEFDVQGLEVDWVGVVWDADFRFSSSGWISGAFKGNRWVRFGDETRRAYMKNAYRVLLTRARQGMVIVVPEGDPSDPTRLPEMYEPTYRYLRSIGIADLCPT